ncbi:DUF4214 domain-containing protein [Actinotalea sp. C106]|uniref:DUF4214 domain-containing protein n=1 Tax=Actinotalea sp. C106 TaxID=2908644 RepID=UPI002028B9E9|nr:DUF4214 domain-containing protein [Actinotalea sp. C106]
MLLRFALSFVLSLTVGVGVPAAPAPTTPDAVTDTAGTALTPTSEGAAVAGDTVIEEDLAVEEGTGGLAPAEGSVELEELSVVVASEEELAQLAEEEVTEAPAAEDPLTTSGEDTATEEPATEEQSADLTDERATEEEGSGDGDLAPEREPSRALAPSSVAGGEDADVLVATPSELDDRVTSEVVETEEFQTLGLTWSGGADIDGLDVQVRTRSEGEWGTWIALETADDSPDEGTPDAEQALRAGTDPVWVGDADAVQLSVAAQDAAGPEGLTLALVSSEEEPLDATTGDVATSASPADAVVSNAFYSGGVLAAAPAAPRIVQRSTWGAPAQTCRPAVASSLVGAVLHHTAGSNAYSTQAQAMQQIRNDAAYHINGRGWCDIGYNYIVDKWGNIYEGRARSGSQPVIGVHAGGFNTGTVGVSMLGTYGSRPSAATERSVAQVIGWRLGAYGVNPATSMSYRTGAGQNSRYTNQTVSLPRVFGHGTVSYTACPGAGGYAALPSIRSMAATYASTYSYATRLPASESIVKALYRDLLGRGVDPKGLSTWSSRLARSNDQPELVSVLTRSDEYINIRVRQAYVEVLGREPDARGAADWLRRIRAEPARVDEVQRQFFDTTEFMTRSGGTTRGYVANMYQSILGRRAAASEVSMWTARIDERGRSWVVDQIWFSQEAARNRAGSYYQVFLKRSPDGAGRAMWGRVLLGKGEGAVRTGIAGSNEYRNRAIARYP